MPSHAIAAVLHAADAAFELREVELDDPRSDEVLVRIDASGVCHTDEECKHLLPVPSVLGHEGTGVIEQVGSAVQHVAPGDQVVMSYPSCGACPNCTSGHAYTCDHLPALAFGGRRLDGSSTMRLAGQPVTAAFFQQSSFATRAVASGSCVVRIPGSVASTLLAALSCGVMTGAGSVVNTLGARAGESIAIFGVGAVGLSAVMAARLTGCGPIVAVDIRPGRLQLALELGATHGLEAGPDTVEQLRAIVSRGVDCALDTSGRTAAMAAMFSGLAMGGRSAIVTPPADPIPGGTLLDRLFASGGTLLSVYQGSSRPAVMIPRLLEWFAAGRFPVDRLIACYPFSEINRAFAEARAGTAVKPVLVMNPPAGVGATP